MPIPDTRKTILFWTALAIVLSGLFPPWLYTFNKLAASDSEGYHSERSAGYAFIFNPPVPHFDGMGSGGQFLPTNIANPKPEIDFAYFGIKLDIARLLVEWVCILAVSGAAWGVARLKREQLREETKIQGGGV